MALSYFDKAVIFLLPILVLQMFGDQSVYLSIEYIYSITIVIIPFLDLGLGSYFYYIYRNTGHKRAIINKSIKIFHLLYFILCCIGCILIAIHYFVVPIDQYIVYITSRAIFLATFAFLSSYYRLINKPEKALFLTIVANIISLIILLLYVFLDKEFELWVIFIGQILFCVFYFLKTTRYILLKWHKHYKNLNTVSFLKASLLFAWPTILQVFIMMFVANYGKIFALDKMSLDDGTLLSLVQRFCMLIHITHTSILAFIVKDIYTNGSEKEIKKSALMKYIIFITASTIFVILLVFCYLEIYNYNFKNFMFVLSGIVAYTYLWCLVSYLELYFSRENKNIFKLYLACINVVIFVSILSIGSMAYLDKIIIAMFASTLATFGTSVLLLKYRKYYLS